MLVFWLFRIYRHHKTKTTYITCKYIYNQTQHVMGSDENAVQAPNADRTSESTQRGCVTIGAERTSIFHNSSSLYKIHNARCSSRSKCPSWLSIRFMLYTEHHIAHTHTHTNTPHHICGYVCILIWIYWCLHISEEYLPYGERFWYRQIGLTIRVLWLVDLSTMIYFWHSYIYICKYITYISKYI